MMLTLLFVVTLTSGAWGHGRLLEPPSRASMWRFGFSNPRNWNDNELFCGGFQNQIAQDGKCGVCGDPWQGPREHEAGGKYANGIIVRRYSPGDVMPITIDITANHKGWFEFRLCPNNDPKRAVTHECLDRHLLELADGSGTRWMLTSPETKQYHVAVRLPRDVTCTQCVVQWKYHAGNTWGTDPDTGRSCTGCGPQEEFYGCADIAISRTRPLPTSRSA